MISMEGACMDSRCGLVRSVALLVLAGCLAPGTARAEILFHEDFEAPRWTAGQVLFYGENPANNGWRNDGSNAVNSITTVNPASGQQALQMQFAGNSSIFASGQRVNFGILSGGMGGDPISSASALFSADFRLDGARTTAPTLNASINAGGSWMALSSDGRAYAGSQGQFSTDVALGQYHRLGMMFDFGQRTTSFLVDGVTIGTESTPWLTTANIGVTTLLGDFTSDPGHFDPSAYTIRFDNLQVAVNAPEPASLALLGLGGLGMAVCGLRSRRRKAASAA
jgi:hypothetical protein